MSQLDTRAPSTRFKTATPKSATYSIRDLSGLFSVSYTAMQEAVQRGDVPVAPIKVGRQYRFPKATVDHLLGMTGGGPEEKVAS